MLPAVTTILALSVPNRTIVVVQDSPPSGTPGSSGSGSGSNEDSNVGEIVGGAVGGTVFLVIATGAGVFFWRRRRQQRSGNYHYDEDALEHPLPYPYRVANQQDYDSSPHTDTDSAAVQVGIGSTRPDVAMESSPMDAAPYVGRSKARKYAREMQQQSRPSQTSFASGSADSSTLPTREVVSSETESSSGTPGASSLSATDVLGLRAEVENLRRVVQGIREERQDPPPRYGE